MKQGPSVELAFLAVPDQCLGGQNRIVERVRQQVPGDKRRLRVRTGLNSVQRFGRYFGVEVLKVGCQRITGVGKLDSGGWNPGQDLPPLASQLGWQLRPRNMSPGV